MISARGCVIVKPVSTEEHRQGSTIILLENIREKLASHQMIVVSVGEPEICEGPEDCGERHVLWNARPMQKGYIVHPTDKRIKPDAWILVKHRSLVEISSAEHLYSVRQDQIVGVFVEDALTEPLT